MRPTLPNLFFESIYFGLVSSVGSGAGTPRLSTVLPIVRGEIAAIHSPITLRSSHIAPPTSSVGPQIWPPVERLASILLWIIDLERT